MFWAPGQAIRSIFFSLSGKKGCRCYPWRKRQQKNIKSPVEYLLSKL